MSGIHQEQSSDIEKCDDDNYNRNYMKDVQLQTAMAKAMELRILHAALMNGHNGHTLNPRFLQDRSSPVYYTHVRQSSAQDYPIFNQSYETEPLPGYKQIPLQNPVYNETWEYHEHKNIDETFEFMNFEPHISPTVRDKTLSKDSSASYRDEATHGYTKSLRNGSGNVTASSFSCNKSETPAVTVTSDRKPNIILPSDNSHSSVDYEPRHRRRMSLSWLFRGLKKKTNKNEKPHIVLSNDSGFDDESIKSLKKELTEACRSRDLALNQVAEMKSSVTELSEKLEYLETYCNELKKALTQEKPVYFPSREKSHDSAKHEAMIEEFLHVVSESRLSVKQFCKALLQQIEETDHTVVDSLNLLLQPYNLSLSSKHRKTLLYHVEALINQTLFQDFENRVFHKSGSPKYLDPQEDQVNKYESFTALQNLSWNAILRKGSQYYDMDFCTFCDRKMSDVITTLGSTTWPWREELVEAFYKAAKCVWLVHLLAFSFDPALEIMRVDENRVFEGRYMEDMLEERRRSNEARRVKVMVMPGFYVHDRVVRCKVLCRYKSVAG